MRCEELRDLMDLYLDGELPEESTRKLDRHLLRCPDCAFEARALEQTRSMLRAVVSGVETSAAFRERVMARLNAAFASDLRPLHRAEAGRQWSLNFQSDYQSDFQSESRRDEKAHG